MTAPILPQPGAGRPIGDPDYEAWLRNNIQKLQRERGMTNDQIREWFLVKQEGLTPDVVNQILPPTTHLPPQRAMNPNQFLGVPGTVMNILGIQPGQPGALRTAAGAGATSLRGITLGATDYVGPLKELAAEYREDRPWTAVGLEVTSGLLVNPFAWLRAAKWAPGAVKAVAGFMAPAARLKTPGAIPAVGRLGVNMARGGAYGSIYGYNTSEPGQRAGGALIGGAAGTVGTLLLAPLTWGAGKLGEKIGLSPKVDEVAREQFGIGMEARDKIAAAQKAASGAIRQPQHPTELPIERADAVELSLAVEALGRSPRGLAIANQVKYHWNKAQEDVPMALANRMAGYPPTGPGKDFENPIQMARDLLAKARSASRPYYQQLNIANPSVPGTPAFNRAVSDGPIREFVQSAEFQNVSRVRAIADDIADILGQETRGKLMHPLEIQAALNRGAGRSPAVAGAIGQLGGKVDPALAARLEAGAVKAGLQPAVPPSSGWDWRTVNTLKKVLDYQINVLTKRAKGEPLKGLGSMLLPDLERVREGLMDGLNQIPLARTALDTYAGPATMRDMLMAGLKDVSKGAQHVAVGLNNPANLNRGKAAMEHYRLGVLAGLQRRVAQAGANQRASGSVWNDENKAVGKLLAEQTGLWPELEAQITRDANLWERFNLIPEYKQRIQTGPAEQMKGRATALAVQAVGGVRGLLFRGANVAQAEQSRMAERVADDIVNYYFWSNPFKALDFLRAGLPQTPNRGGEVAGRLAGQGLTALSQP